jgi:hypothetical protein
MQATVPSLTAEVVLLPAILIDPDSSLEELFCPPANTAKGITKRNRTSMVGVVFFIKTPPYDIGCWF